MSDVPPASDLLARVQQLAREKASLHLVLRLMERLNPLASMDDLVRDFLSSIVDTIGGTNIKLFYWDGPTLHYVDFLGVTKVIAAIDDPLAKAVMDQRQVVEQACHINANLLHDGAILESCSWGFPLLVGQELIGVITLENIHISSRSLGRHLPVFFEHAALVLSNELRRNNRERAEAALRQKTEELDNYFNNALDLFAIADAHGCFRKLNPAWERVTGYQPSELTGKHILSFVHPDDRRTTFDAIATLATQQPLTTFVNRYRGADGSWRWIEWRSTASGDLIYAAARDITERRRAEEALADSEARARTMLRTAMDAIWLLDRDGHILEVNDAACRMVGFSRQEMIGLHVSDFECAESNAQTQQRIQRILQQGVDLFESAHRRKDGSQFPVEVSVTMLPEQQQMLSFIRDITERKSAERALRESEERFNTAFQFMPVAVGITTLQTGQFITVNRAFEAVFGYQAETVAGRSSSDFQIWADPEDRVRVVEKLLAGQSVSDHETPIRHMDGSTRWVSYSGQIVQLNGIRCLLSGAVDITDRRQAEERLRESEARLADAQRLAHLGNWEHDPQTGAFACSDEFLRIFELDAPPPHEGVLSAVHPDDRARVKSAYAQGPIVGEGQQLSYRLLLSDRRIKHVQETRVAVSGPGGGVSRLIGTIQDVTDRRQLEERLQQAQKMEAIGNLAGGVAHDFNNMLCVILGQTELALDELACDHPLRAPLEQIQSAAERSACLTQQLLAFARRQTIAPQTLDLNHTVEGMLKMLRRLIGEDIALTWCPGEDLWSVHIDPSQVDQVLANLCVNARDAIAGIGNVTIATSNVTVDATHCLEHPGFVPGDYVLLSVADDGCGMSKEVQERIFEPFFTTKGLGKGTGLGLATIYGIATQNNGFVNVVSEPDKGATFGVYLRRHDGAGPPSQPGAPRHFPRGHGETVLLVEDEPALLEMASAMMTRLGFRVLSAATPKQAVELAVEAGDKLCLLMTDVVMPEMNGRELHALLAVQRPGLKCLYISGHAADVITPHGELGPGASFLAKPFSLHALSAKLGELLCLTT